VSVVEECKRKYPRYMVSELLLLVLFFESCGILAHCSRRFWEVLFFLSGFLITTLMLRELSDSGSTI
jgi:peptidoglycan/LPS O-acetylase OafA/YrhL